MPSAVATAPTFGRIRISQSMDRDIRDGYHGSGGYKALNVYSSKMPSLGYGSSASERNASSLPRRRFSFSVAKSFLDVDDSLVWPYSEHQLDNRYKQSHHFSSHVTGRNELSASGSGGWKSSLGRRATESNTDYSNEFVQSTSPQYNHSSQISHQSGVRHAAGRPAGSHAPLSRSYTRAESMPRFDRPRTHRLSAFDNSPEFETDFDPTTSRPRATSMSKASSSSSYYEDQGQLNEDLQLRQRVRAARSQQRAASLSRVEQRKRDAIRHVREGSIGHAETLRAGHTGRGVSPSSGSLWARAGSVSNSDKIQNRNVIGNFDGAAYSAADVEAIADKGDISAYVLEPGEKFLPTDVKVALLPSGKKAVTYTKFSQKGHGDQRQANVEIERIVQRTKHLQDSMHTLEDFVKRNRSLFPDDIIIYQRIVFYLLSEEELKRMGERPDAEIYGVRIREKLVAPIGTDVTSILKKYYSKHTEVDIEYQDKDSIIRQRDQVDRGEEPPDDATTSRRRRRRTEITEEEETWEMMRNRMRADRLKERRPSVEDWPTLKHRQASSSSSSDRTLYIDEDELMTTKSLARGKAPRPQSLPQFSSALRSKKIVAGHDVQLNCFVDGNPDPMVTWYHGNRMVVDDGHCRVIVSIVVPVFVCKYLGTSVRLACLKLKEVLRLVTNVICYNSVP